jgi:hypothetical protein
VKFSEIDYKILKFYNCFHPGSTGMEAELVGRRVWEKVSWTPVL